MFATFKSLKRALPNIEIASIDEQSFFTETKMLFRYLICPTCRLKFLKRTPSGHQQVLSPIYSNQNQERTRRWREFRMSAAAFDLRPETVIKQNAAFLLELNSSVHEDSKDSSTATSGWTINLFPQTTPPPTFRSACVQTTSIRDKVLEPVAYKFQNSAHDHITAA